jgi:hypothetical protein
MQDPDLRIRLPLAHWTYLANSLELPTHLLQRLRQAQPCASPGSRVDVVLTAEEADDMRNRCAEQLQLRGFGADYELNDEGRMLQELIDYLFTG